MGRGRLEGCCVRCCHHQHASLAGMARLGCCVHRLGEEEEEEEEVVVVAVVAGEVVPMNMPQVARSTASKLEQKMMHVHMQRRDGKQH